MLMSSKRTGVTCAVVGVTPSSITALAGQRVDEGALAGVELADDDEQEQLVELLDRALERRHVLVAGAEAHEARPQVVEDAPLLADHFLLSRIDESLQRHPPGRCRMHAIRRGRPTACSQFEDLTPGWRSGDHGRMPSCWHSRSRRRRRRRAASRMSRRSRRRRSMPSRWAAARCMSRRASVGISTRCAGPMGEPLQYKRTGSLPLDKEGRTILDTYEITYPGLEKPVIFYLDALSLRRCAEGAEGVHLRGADRAERAAAGCDARVRKPAAAGDRAGRGEGLRADLARRGRQQRARRPARSLPAGRARVAGGGRGRHADRSEEAARWS